jgi:uncharacterized RDD family membrane protein YckC
MVSKPLPAPAGLGPRFLAYILDALILITLTFPLGLIFEQGSLLLMLAGTTIQLYYYTISQSSDWQATPGKHIMKIHVVDQFGGRLSKRRAFERALAQLLPTLPLFSSLASENAATLALWASLVWFVPILFTPLRTGVHDMLCQTRVVTGEPMA